MSVGEVTYCRLVPVIVTFFSHRTKGLISDMMITWLNDVISSAEPFVLVNNTLSKFQSKPISSV